MWSRGIEPLTSVVQMRGATRGRVYTAYLRCLEWLWTTAFRTHRHPAGSETYMGYWNDRFQMGNKWTAAAGGCNAVLLAVD